MGPLEFLATDAMLKWFWEPIQNGRQKTFDYPYVLSDAAAAFIRDNDLGGFTIVSQLRPDDMDSIVITAPDKYAATIFRLAF